MTDAVSYLFIIGAPKAGTTSLALWLGARSDVVLGEIKEPRSFTDFGERDWTGPQAEKFKQTLCPDRDSWYANFGDYGPQTRWLVDASTDYLSCAASLPMISRFAETHRVKVILSLRDPVERAISEYHHTVRDAMESASLARSVALEEERRAKGWQPLFAHIRRSHYADDVARYDARFGDDLLVLNFQEVQDQATLMSKVERFLDLPPMKLVRPLKPANESRMPANGALRTLHRSSALRAVARKVVPDPLRDLIHKRTYAHVSEIVPAAEEDRALIRAKLKDDIAACAAHPRIDVSGWHTAIPQNRN